MTDSETAEDIGHRLLKEAQTHYFGDQLANITYPSRVSAQRVRSFIQRQANCMASLLEQIRVARLNVVDDGPGSTASGELPPVKDWERHRKLIDEMEHHPDCTCPALDCKLHSHDREGAKNES